MAYNKETRMYEGFIYKIFNDVDEVFYIGRTYRTVEIRWMEHLACSIDHQNDLYKGMRKYGIEKFHISIIEQFSSTLKDTIKQLSYDKEKYWIKYYKDNGYILYNMNDGGDDVAENRFPERPVIQYDLFCRELNNYNSISQASDITGINHSDISTCCSKNGKIYCTDNYIWRYADDPLSQDEITVLNERYRGTCQYDFNGNLLNVFYRPRDAVNYVMEHDGIQLISGNISSCMNGNAKSAGGYIWRYRGDPFDLYPLPKQIRRVEQRTLAGDLLAIYNNCADAQRHTGVDSSGINLCCLKQCKHAGGYIWCYENDLYETDIKLKEHPVDRYDKDGNYIDSYPSIKSASETLKIHRSTISKVCYGKGTTAGGYVWKFKHQPIDICLNNKGGDNVA